MSRLKARLWLGSSNIVSRKAVVVLYFSLEGEILETETLKMV